MKPQNNPKKDQKSPEKSTKKLVKEAEVTQEDLEALGPEDDNLHDDGGADESLLKRKQKVDFAGTELDVPGEELDDTQEAIGSEDEENNHYSLPDDKD